MNIFCVVLVCHITVPSQEPKILTLRFLKKDGGIVRVKMPPLASLFSLLKQ